MQIYFSRFPDAADIPIDINIKQIYGTMSTEKSPVRVVMATSDNQTAIVTLKKAAVK
jgi:hypothetical protein